MTRKRRVILQNPDDKTIARLYCQNRTLLAPWHTMVKTCSVHRQRSVLGAIHVMHSGLVKTWTIQAGFKDTASFVPT